MVNSKLFLLGGLYGSPSGLNGHSGVRPYPSNKIMVRDFSVNNAYGANNTATQQQSYTQISGLGQNHNIYTLYQGKLYIFGGWKVNIGSGTNHGWGGGGTTGKGRNYRDTQSFQVLDLAAEATNQTAFGLAGSSVTTTFTYSTSFKLGPWGDNELERFFGGASVVYDNCMYIIGGRGRKTGESSHEYYPYIFEYNFDLNQWTRYKKCNFPSSNAPDSTWSERPWVVMSSNVNWGGVPTFFMFTIDGKFFTLKLSDFKDDTIDVETGLLWTFSGNNVDITDSTVTTFGNITQTNLGGEFSSGKSYFDSYNSLYQNNIHEDVRTRSNYNSINIFMDRWIIGYWCSADGPTNGAVNQKPGFWVMDLSNSAVLSEKAKFFILPDALRDQTNAGNYGKNGFPCMPIANGHIHCAFGAAKYDTGNQHITTIEIGELLNEIKWGAGPNRTGNDKYTIQRKLSGANNFTTLANNVTETKYDIGLPPAAGTSFRIQYNASTLTSSSIETITLRPPGGLVENVVFTNSSSTGVSIGFDSVANTAGYKIERKRVDVTEAYTIKSTINDNNITTYSDTGLSPGALYFYRLRSRKNSSVDNPQRTKRAFVSKFTKPAFTSTSIGNKKTILNWGGVGANKYILKRSSDGGNTYSDIATNITGTTYTDSGLTNNSNYKYKLVASEKTFEIPATYDSNTTKATWNVEDLTILGKFTLIKKETNENSFSVIKENISESATETTVDAAHQSATAEYKIRFNYSVDSPESDQTADITPKHPASGNPDFGADGISKIDANLTSLVVEFSNNIQSGRANSNEIDKDDFEITRQDSLGNSSTITIDSYSMSGNKITFLYPSNTDMTSYAGDTFTVRYTKKSNDEDYHLYDNVNNRFLSSSSSIKSVTNIIPPKKVIWAASDPVKAGNRKTKLSWASVAGTSYYKVQVKKDSDNYQERAEKIPGDRTSFTIRNLKNNSNYKFKIKSYKINASGDIEGEVSDESILSEVKALVGFTDLKAGLSTATQTNLDNTINSLSVSTPGSVKKEFEDNKSNLITNQNINFADVPRVREAFKSILTSFDDITDVVEKKRKKRQARTEAIQMIFDLDDGILTFEAEAEDLDIEVFSDRPNKYKVTLPKGKEINVFTLDVGEFVLTPEYKLNGYYIPLQNEEGAILKFGNDSILLEKVIDGNDEKTHISVMDGTIVVNEVISLNTDFSIIDSTKNYLFPDDKITLNNVNFVIGSATILAEIQPATIKPQQPGRKQHKPLASGFFEHPGSVVNNLFMSGNFGSGLSNRKLTTLNKNQTKYKDYRLGATPTAPHQEWSQPVRPNLGSTDRLLRLKASAIKKSN